MTIFYHKCLWSTLLLLRKCIMNLSHHLMTQNITWSFCCIPSFIYTRRQSVFFHTCDCHSCSRWSPYHVLKVILAVWHLVSPQSYLKQMWMRWAIFHYFFNLNNFEKRLDLTIFVFQNEEKVQRNFGSILALWWKPSGGWNDNLKTKATLCCEEDRVRAPGGTFFRSWYPHLFFQKLYIQDILMMRVINNRPTKKT